MTLTPEQLQIIRNSVTDDDAFERVVALFDAIHPPASQENLPPKTFLFNLDSEQVALLSAVLNAIPVAVYIKDLDSRFVIVNPHTVKLLNAASEREIIGKTDFDLLKPEDAQYHFDLEQELLRTGEAIFDLELNWEDEDVGIRWVLTTKSPIRDEHGRIVGLIGVNRDITRQKLTEKSLENQRNLLQTVIDQIQDKIYVKDRHSRFVTANAMTLSEQRKPSLDELAGTTDFDYMDSERAQRLFDEEQRIMATGVPLINQELYTPPEVTRHHGMWFLISKVPIYDEHGEVTGLIGVNRNITSQKLAEQRRIELEVEREKSEILSAFITDSSHEFRTPFSIILTSAYLLEKVNDREQQQGFAAMIRQQIERLTILVDSLQLMMRLDRETRIPSHRLDLNAVLKRAAASALPEIQNKNQTLHLDLEDSEAEVSGDEELLTQAISAVVDNAVRYTPDNGDITLRSYAQDDHIVIAIQDTGIGISDEVRAVIFNRFYRADEARTSSGFGLGLPIARRIIELHGGCIEVESQIDSGSTFRISLPQSAAVPQSDGLM